jgi:hypothetical protein
MRNSQFPLFSYRDRGMRAKDIPIGVIKYRDSYFLGLGDTLIY